MRLSCFHNPKQRVRSGFTLPEALMAISIGAIAGAALLTSLGNAIGSSDEAIYRVVGQGLAEQLIDEIAFVRFPQSDENEYNFTDGFGRADFDDIDDYAAWSSTPPVARNGQTIGMEGSDQLMFYGSERLLQKQPNSDFINNFTRTVSVEVVEPDDETSWDVIEDEDDHQSYTVLPFRLHLSGKYFSIVSFLYGLENRDRLVSIRQLTLSLPNQGHFLDR